MARKKTKLAYSTDPQAAQSREKKEPAAAFAAQGDQPVRVWLERKGRGGKVVSDQRCGGAEGRQASPAKEAQEQFGHRRSAQR